MQTAGAKLFVSTLSIVFVLCLSSGCGDIISQLKGPSKPLEGVSSPSFKPQSITKMAVLVSKNRYASERLIEDEFVIALLGKGYKIAARSDIKKVIKEIRFQQSGITDSDAARLGKLLNVPAVLVVDVNEVHKDRSSRNWTILKATIGARLISVSKAEVLWICRHSGKIYDFQHDSTFDSVIRPLSAKVAQSFPSRY